ncbi:hypothetical protein ACYTIB_000940 [Acinetobacter baumannii]
MTVAVLFASISSKTSVAMQVAHFSYVLNMADPAQLKQLIEKVKPNLIVPEIEAIAGA